MYKNMCGLRNAFKFLLLFSDIWRIMDIKKAGAWRLETTYNPAGWKRDDIVLESGDVQASEAYKEEADRAYAADLRQKVDFYREQGEEPFLQFGGGDFVPADAVDLSDWEERPALYTQREGEQPRKVGFDGDTVVASYETMADGNLAIRADTGKYAWRLAATRLYEEGRGEEFDLDNYLSLNTTVIPLFHDEDGETPVAPVFLRSEGMSEYGGYWHTIAGGLGDPERHPNDSTWKEMVEEGRIGPEAGSNEAAAAQGYVDRGILPGDVVETMRSGTIGDQRVYTVAAEADDNVATWQNLGLTTVFRADEGLTALGVVRNLENNAPELIYTGDTGLEKWVLDENYVQLDEHRELEWVEMTREGVADFFDTHQPAIPILAGAFVLTADYWFDDGYLDEAEDYGLMDPM